MHWGRATGSQLLACGQDEHTGRAGEHLGLGQALLGGPSTSEGLSAHFRGDFRDL